MAKMSCGELLSAPSVSPASASMRSVSSSPEPELLATLLLTMILVPRKETRRTRRNIAKPAIVRWTTRPSESDTCSF